MLLFHTRRTSFLFALLPLLLLALVVVPSGAQSDDEDEVVEKSSEFLLNSDEIYLILGLFEATSEKLDATGRIELVYDFEQNDKNLSEDWVPKMNAKNPALRWAKGDDGAAEGLRGGILIADTGQWFHKAVLAQDVKFDVHFMSFCGGANKDLVAATYAWSKLSKRIGSNLGTQCIALSGTKAAAATGGPAPTITYEEKVNFGLELKDGEFSWLLSGSSRGSTDSKKLLNKLDSGQVGLVWSGRISAAIPKVTISGKLDLEWAGKEVKSLGTRYAEFQKAQKKDEKGSSKKKGG